MHICCSSYEKQTGRIAHFRFAPKTHAKIWYSDETFGKLTRSAVTQNFTVILTEKYNEE